MNTTGETNRKKNENYSPYVQKELVSLQGIRTGCDRGGVIALSVPLAPN